MTPQADAYWGKDTLKGQVPIKLRYNKRDFRFFLFLAFAFPNQRLPQMHQKALLNKVYLIRRFLLPVASLLPAKLRVVLTLANSCKPCFRLFCAAR